VAVADVGEFMSQHRLDLPVVQRVEEPCGDGDGILAPVQPGRERVERRAVHDLEFRHRDAAGDAEIFKQIIEPRLLLPRHGFAAGDGVDHVLVEEIGDHDPQRGNARRIGKGHDQVAIRPYQIIVDRAVSASVRLAPRSKNSRGVKPNMPANKAAGICWMPVLYSWTALLKRRRLAAILFSRSESSPASCWKLALALRSG